MIVFLHKRIVRKRGFLTGFTLVELLLATFIIGLTLVAAIEMFVVSTKTDEESGNEIIALNLVQQRLEEVKKLQYAGVDISVGTGTNTADGFLPALTEVSTDEYLTGFYLTDSNVYRAGSSLLKMSPQRRLDLITQISWVDDLYGGSAQDYKQVKVTAFWQEPSQIKSFSLSTYAYYVGSQTSIGASITVPDTGQTYDAPLILGEDSYYNSVAQPIYTEPIPVDGTITDNITGLTWIKDPSLAGINNLYTWTNALTTCLGLAYAGGGWRLPNIKELWSIVRYEGASPYIGFAPLCQSDYYWASTTNSGDASCALAINFASGQCIGRVKTNTAYIRPVRSEGKLVDSGQTTSYSAGDDGANNPAAIQPNFTDNEDGTISDNISGLMWIKNPVAAGIGGTYNWETAITTCENLDYANIIKWRLPNVKELMSVLNYQNNPAICPDNFTVSSGYYWTSTSDVAGGSPGDNALVINLGDGTSSQASKSNSYRILPVCGGEL